MRCADFNNCYCADPSSAERFFEGDVKFLTDAGLDGVKIDGCGAQRNNTLYAELMRKTSKNYTIEKYSTQHFFRTRDSVHPAAVLLFH